MSADVNRGFTPLDFLNTIRHGETGRFDLSVTTSCPPQPTRKNLTGFTLVELLVTSALLALMAGAVVATLAGALKVWQRAEDRGTNDQWVQVAFHQVRQDLQNVRRFKPIPFEGDYESFSFPTVITRSTAPETEVEALGERGYFFDWNRRNLCRSEHPYQGLRRVRLTDSCSPVLTGLDRLRFSYYGFDPHTNTYDWSATWSSPEPPVAVKMEIRRPGPSPRPNPGRGSPQQPPATHTLVVYLPLAALPPPKPQ